MWRPVTSGMVDVIYIGYAAFAGAFDTKRATICRLQANFTFDKCEFTAHWGMVLSWREWLIVFREGSTAPA